MNTRDLSAHTAYVPGRGTDEVATEFDLAPEDIVPLGSNENPLGPSPDAVDAIEAATTTVNTYPKASHTELIAAIADHWDVSAKQVWLSPGADGAIDYLSRAFLDPGEQVLVPTPGFAYYAMSTRYHHGRIDTYPVPAAQDFAMTPETILQAYDGHRLIHITTPHNPTGAVMTVDEIRHVAANTDPDTLVVVDEAYGEFSTTDSARQLLAERSDIAVLRTFSKAYGLAGLRVGYALVPTAWGEAYERINTPFAVNELACQGARAALADTTHLEKSIERARTARTRLHEELTAPTWQSEGNFVLAEVGDGAAVASALKQEGIIVRDCSSFGLPEHIRISAGTTTQIDRVITRLNDLLTQEAVER